MNIEKPVAFLNPVLKVDGDEMDEIWDDCMSSPDILVKVKRYKKCSIMYRDLEWRENTMILEDSMAELLQHEYDHLEGVLAISKAVDKYSFVLRSQMQFIMEGL